MLSKIFCRLNRLAVLPIQINSTQLPGVWQLNSTQLTGLNYSTQINSTLSQVSRNASQNPTLARDSHNSDRDVILSRLPSPEKSSINVDFEADFEAFIGRICKNENMTSETTFCDLSI